METIVIGSICFFSYLLGFFAVFMIMGKYYLREDNLMETNYASIRPGQFSTKDKSETVTEKQSKESKLVFLTQEDDVCNENISDRTDGHGEEEIQKGLCDRIPRKDNSYTEFVSNLKEEESFDENMKHNMKKENDAYKIIKRKKQEHTEK